MNFTIAQLSPRTGQSATLWKDAASNEEKRKTERDEVELQLLHSDHEARSCDDENNDDGVAVPCVRLL